MATPKRDSKGRFKGATARKSNPKRRRKRSTTAVAKRSTRRRNPSTSSGGGGGVTINSGMVDLGPVLLSRIMLAWAVRTFGKSWGVSAISGAPIGASPYAGQAWPMKNYIGTLTIGFVLAKILSRGGRNKFARIFWQTTVRDTATRFLWTEGIARVPGAQAYLGDVPGTLWRDGGGNTFELDQWKRWQAMQGVLEPARPLDGLEMARPLDGLTGARSIDMANGGYGPRVHMSGPRWMRRAKRIGRGGRRFWKRHGRTVVRLGRRAGQAFGHLLPEDTDPARALRGSYTGSGFVDPYNAVYGAR